MADRLIITHIPSLVATLLNKERAKGLPLTRDEVERIRDEAPAQVLTPQQRQAVDEGRQYQDINPENVWDEWQIARIELTGEDESR